MCRVHLAAGGVEDGGGMYDKKRRRWGGGKGGSGKGIGGGWKNDKARAVPVPKSAWAPTGMNAIALGGVGEGGKEDVDANEIAGEGEREEESGRQENFKLVTAYRPILFVDFVGNKELVVVERPLVDVLAKLPPAFFKPKYGAT